MTDSDSNIPTPENSPEQKIEPSLDFSPAGERTPPPMRGNAQAAPRKSGIGPLAWVLGLSAVFFALFLAISGAIYFSRGGVKGSSRSSGGAFLAAGKGSVGIIELNGVIMDSKKTLKKLEDYEESPGIKAVVLRLNSPGGAVAPSQEIYQAVKNYKKPLVVSMSSVAASGAYYVAMGAKKVYANPGTITGSIGVIMEFANLEKLYEWAKVQRYAIKTGKFKDVGAEYREMGPEERALLQTMVDDVLSQFKQAVSDGRKLTMEQVTEVADGRIFSGSQAKAAKLVDELGTLQDAVNEAGKLAGIEGKPDVVYPEKSRSRLIDLILDNGSGDDRSEGSSSLVGALTSILNGHVEKAVTGLEPGIYWIWTGAR
jgi:protease-4